MYIYQHTSRQNVNTDWIFFWGGAQEKRPFARSSTVICCSLPLLDMTTRLHAETNTANTESARSATTRTARY